MSMFPIASERILTNQVADIYFTNIPQTFTHLQVRIWARGIASGSLSAWYAVINGDAAVSAYTSHSFTGNGSSTGSSGSTNNTISIDGLPSTSALANTFSATIIDLYDYTSTTKRKSIRWVNGWDDNGTSGTNAKIIFCDSLAVNQTAAVTSLQFGAYNPNGSGWAAGSTIQLYGIGTSSATGV